MVKNSSDEEDCEDSSDTDSEDNALRIYVCFKPHPTVSSYKTTSSSSGSPWHLPFSVELTNNSSRRFSCDQAVTS